MVYLDNAATTRLREEVLEAMMPFLTTNYGNASSIYKIGREAKQAIVKARETVARVLGTEPDRIFFIGSGSEGINWAIKGTAYANAKKGKHIITSVIEHHAVLHSCQTLERDGFEVTYLPVDKEGFVSPDDLKKELRDDTTLVALSHANNEIGTIQPIAELSKIARDKGVRFFADAVQTVGHIPTNVDELGVDVLTLSAHKFNGPKGVGALYVRKGIKLDSWLDGGGQERNMRGGTENVAGIVGLGKALELASTEMETESERLTKLRDGLIEKVLSTIPYSRLNGSKKNRLPNNTNFVFELIEGESILLMLDMEGIAGSSGSACTSASLEVSHVLAGIGVPHEIAHGSLRLSLGIDTTQKDLDFVVDKLAGIVEKLRAMSPLKATV
jgi:cysteine desulfurase